LGKLAKQCIRLAAWNTSASLIRRRIASEASAKSVADNWFRFERTLLRNACLPVSFVGKGLTRPYWFFLPWNFSASPSPLGAAFGDKEYMVIFYAGKELPKTTPFLLQ